MVKALMDNSVKQVYINEPARHSNSDDDFDKASRAHVILIALSVNAPFSRSPYTGCETLVQTSSLLLRTGRTAVVLFHKSQRKN